MRLRLRLALLLVTFLFSVETAFPQSVGESRLKSCVADSLAFRIDTLSMVPGTFSIANLERSQYRVDPIAAKLYLLDSALLGRVLVCQYQVYALDFTKPIRRHQLSEIESPRGGGMITYGMPAETDLYGDARLLTSGYVSRGVTVGNNQDLVLNSALNLQISGDLNEDFRIVASISDKNIPIQPEGNTQYLSDINSIFITLYYKEMAKVDAGDILVGNPGSGFLKVSRNLLGMDASVRYTAKEKVRATHSLGGGIAKGNFVRQKLNIQNGVQGPYKLYGPNNEVGIVVVAGSERVYVDGVLLTRGQENDYTMDYNAAEITFTPAMLMSSEKRVYVEFECTDRHFTRIGLFSYNELTLGKKQQVKLNVNYFQEQDLKNQSIQPELGNDEKLFLSQLGDDLQNAWYARADSVQYSTNRLLYARRDTTVNGVAYPNVYVYSTDEGVQLYSVGFSFVGQGKGDYVLLRSTSNGRVFGWVAPEDGESRGDYVPAVLLVAPQRARMATIAATWNARQGTTVAGEVALSEHDHNLFSKGDDRDNVGFAANFAFGHRQMLGKKEKSSPWSFVSRLDWQFVHRNFHAVESFRDVEFARDYNLNADYSSLHSEQMLHALIGFDKKNVSISQYEFNWFTRFGEISALRQELLTRNTFGHTLFDARVAFLTTSDSVQRSRFLAGDVKWAYRLKTVEFGMSDKMEHNIFRVAALDTLRANSYAFNELLIYLKNGDSTVYKYNISYKNRLEFAPDSGRLAMRQGIQEANALFQFNRIRNQHFAAQATYRTQRVHGDVQNHVREHYFVGDVEYTGRFFHNAILLSTYYEAGSSMEQKRTYTFLKVAAGQGTHTWRDYNGNGIEEMDEFEVAAFQDEANYVKVWITGTDYVNAYQNAFTQSVQIRPAAVWSNKKGFRRFLARFSDVAQYRTRLKYANPNFNPFYADMGDTNLLSRTMNVNNTFSFNNSASKFSFDFVVQKSRNKNLLYYGSEYNDAGLQQVTLRSNIGGKVVVETHYLHGVTGNHSDFMATRNYEFERHGVGGKLRLQLQDKYVGELAYVYVDKRGRVGDGHLRVHDANMLFNVKLARRGVATATFRYVGMLGQAPTNAAAAYQMLDGLAVGHNAVWALDLQFALTEYLNLSLRYDGRVSQGHKAVHTGSVSVRAQF